jgi:hypothetical protein
LVISALLSGINSEAHKKLLQRFVSDEKPFYNAIASPIDALRTGAILEDRYLSILDDSYYPQYKCSSKEMDVLMCTIDFAKIENGVIVDFDELKTCNFSDFLKFESIKENKDLLFKHVLKNFKKNYEQIQEQLYCSELESANLVYLAVYSYIDEENQQREIKSNEFIKVRINRDEKVIEQIKQRADIFQKIKDVYKLKL